MSPSRLSPLVLVLPALAGLAGLAAPPARAQEACYADYKASRREPFELHYGVAEIRGACSEPEAARELPPRIEPDGWRLLEVVSTFGPEGLEERRASAGDFFLRY